MTDYRRAVNAPQQSLGAVTLRDRSFTNTNTVDFLSNVKPPPLFRKWLPRAWNRHCESHVTLPCLLVIEPRGEGAGAAAATHHPAPCEEQGEPGLPGCWALLPYLPQERLCPTCLVASVSVGSLGMRCCCVSWQGKGVWAACDILGKAGLACSRDTQNATWEQESVGVSPPHEAWGSQSPDRTCRWGRTLPPTATGVSLHFWPCRETGWHFLAAKWSQTGQTNVCAPLCTSFPVPGLVFFFSITQMSNSLLEVSLVSLQDLALVLILPHSIHKGDLVSEHSPFWVHLDNPEVLSSLHKHIT